jgi:hypothetical protein
MPRHSVCPAFVRGARTARADLTFDALPDRVLSGRVVRIAPMSTPGQAATSYTVIIEFDEVEPVLRWGMTAFVAIQVE